MEAGNATLPDRSRAVIIQQMPSLTNFVAPAIQVQSAHTEEQVRAFLSQGEHEGLEFKAGIPTPRDIARVLAAFANAAGGTLLLGVGDDASVWGVGVDKATRALEKAKGHLEPLPEISAGPVLLDNKHVFVVQVAVSNLGPVLADSIPYIRTGAGIRRSTATAKAGELVRIARRMVSDEAGDRPEIHALAKIAEKQTDAIQRLQAKLEESLMLRNKLPELFIGGFIGAVLGILLSLLLR